MKILLSLGLLCAVPSVVFCAGEERKSFPSSGLTILYIATETGDINAEEIQGGEVRVEVTGNEPEKCLLSMQTEGGKLVLKAEGKPVVIPRGWKNLFGLIGPRGASAACGAGFKVSAPPALRLEAVSGTGKISAAGMQADATLQNGTGEIFVYKLSGSVDLKSGTGSISGDLCARHLNVKSGTGKVFLNGLCGPAEVKTGTGRVALAWTKPPASGAARVETGTGDIALSFPAAAKVGASLISGTGSINNEFTGGDFHVFAKSGTGDILLFKTK